MLANIDIWTYLFMTLLEQSHLIPLNCNVETCIFCKAALKQYCDKRYTNKFELNVNLFPNVYSMTFCPSDINTPPHFLSYFLSSPLQG